MFKTIAQMQTNPEFEPYIERYKELKAQYASIHTPVNTKFFLSISPIVFLGNKLNAIKEIFP